MKKLFLLLLIVSGLSIPGNSQSKSLQAGGRASVEFMLQGGTAYGFGGQLVYRLNKHSGFESGLYYQRRPEEELVVQISTGTSSQFYYLYVAERRLHLPLLYRYDSKAINFVAGPVFDFYVAKSVRGEGPDLKMTGYKVPAMDLITTAGISRSFYLSPSWILEPETRFNFNTSRNECGVGINISVRKKLF